MKIEVIITDRFKIRVELLGLEKELSANPKLGTPLGTDCYKIRLAAKSKGIGKSGGVRIITHIIVKFKITDCGLTRVYMAYIYDKSEFESVSQKDIRRIIDEINEGKN